MRPNRRNLILIAAAVGIVFIVGLAVQGPVGGVLLLLVAVTLAVFTAKAWGAVRREGRPLRVAVLIVVVVLAVLKLSGRL